MNDKKISELLNQAEKQRKKLNIQPKKIHHSEDGRLIIDTDNEFEKEWYDNDEKYDNI